MGSPTRPNIKYSAIFHPGIVGSTPSSPSSSTATSAAVFAACLSRCALRPWSHRMLNKTANKMPPCHHVNGPKKASPMNKTEARIIRKNDFFGKKLAVCSPAIRAGRPKTSKIFAVFEPITLPIAKPDAPSAIADKTIKSSGAEVPNATTVKLTSSAEIPRRSAKLTAPRTKKSPANKRVTRPKATKIQANFYPLR